MTRSFQAALDQVAKEPKGKKESSTFQRLEKVEDRLDEIKLNVLATLEAIIELKPILFRTQAQRAGVRH